MRKIFILLAFAILLPVLGFAATSTPTSTPSSTSNGASQVVVGGGTGVDLSGLQYGLPGGTNDSKNPAGLIANIYEFALLVGGILAFGSIVYGGVQYLTTAGNTSAQHEAKDRIRDALIGLLLLVGVYFVMNIVSPDLTKLRFPTMAPLPEATKLSVMPKFDPNEDVYACYSNEKPEIIPMCWKDKATCESLCEDLLEEQGLDTGIIDDWVCELKKGSACNSAAPIVAGGYGYQGVTVPANTLTDAAARSQLQTSGLGITVNKGQCQNPPSATCVSEHRQCESCTSLSGMPQRAVDVLIQLANACTACRGGNAIVVTGGTEAGHSTHGMGKPIMDLRPNSALNAYIYSATGKSSWQNYEKKTVGPITYMWEDTPPHWHLIFQ